MTTKDWQNIEDSLNIKLGRPFKWKNRREVRGGGINRAFIVDGVRESLFIKVNQDTMLPSFAVEAKALKEIASTNTVRVPEVLGFGVSGGMAYLALENLNLDYGTAATQAKLGEKLARMHTFTLPKFGWTWDNAIGSTPQHNSQTDDWIRFWKTQRIGFQLDLAASKGYTGRLQDLGAELLACMDQLFLGHRPSPSLLHGDLWSGNTAITRSGEHVIFDPASYYGDRECDLAMTELFGGFNREFYVAYVSILPNDDGYAVRKTVYNLYHILNHLNLFGGGYLLQVETAMEHLLSELG